MTRRTKSLASIALLLIVSVPLRAAWTTKRLTNDSAASLEPAITIDGPDVYVVWSHETPGLRNIYFKNSSNGGATWQGLQRLTKNSLNSRNPKIAANGSSIYVVWEDHAPAQEGIYFRRSLNGGATWKSARRLTNSPVFAWRPAIAVSGSNVYVAWSDIVSGNYEIYFRKSADSGATWQSTERLTNNSGSSDNPALAVSGSNVYIVWKDNTLREHEEIYFRKSPNGGATWQSAQRFMEYTGTSLHPTVTAGGSNVYVAWHHYMTENSEIYFTRSSDRGATWQSIQRLTKNSGASGAAELAVSGSNIYITWYDNTPGNYEIYFRKSADGGTNWAGAQRLTTNSGKSQVPAIAADDSNLYVVWDDDTPGNFEIYIAFIRFPTGSSRGG